MNGLIVLDKPAGISSARAVAAVKRLLPRGTRIGHAGTLDPFATGLLILLVGPATRRCEQIMSWRKTYQATVKLGATTVTDDPDSPEQPFEAAGGVDVPSRESIEQALRGFIGAIEQRPPVYSAIKIGGRRASDRAREGAQLQLKPRIVQVYGIEFLSYEWPAVRLRIECGRGTYVRSIARDLGERLGVGGYVTALRRTRIGEFGVERACTLDQLSEQNIEQHLRAG